MARRARNEADESRSLLRHDNLRRAMQVIVQHPGIATRAEIARTTGVTAATASSLVAQLIDANLVVEGEQAASSGGKRATTLHVDGSYYALGVFVVTPSDIRAALLDLNATVITEQRVEGTPTTHIAAIVAIAQQWQHDYGDRLLSIAVQVQGATDGEAVLESVAMGWHDTDIAEPISEVFSGPIRLVNDVDAAAVTEALLDSEPSGLRLFAYMGEGVGAAVTIDGRLLAGKQGRTGEIGHVRSLVGGHDMRCECGRIGCLEAVASFQAMVGIDFTENTDHDALARHVTAADPERIDQGALALAQTLSLLSAMLAPREVVLGGAAHVLGEPFLRRVQSVLADPPRGTLPVPVRFARQGAAPFAGVGQAALQIALGLAWGPAQMHPDAGR
ncbi:ROK family transcriptional regulator [Microbacterium sp. YY-01]|uniref:ROK family transcriptional regulator n=1 Tax=Microbacterium sp. YY-01 TaxID=3421634 RepID=UPI003D186AE9